MEPQQLLELANNAELDHWPPHLGVHTDAEKVEYLTRALRDTFIRDAQIEELERRVDELEEETVDLETNLDDSDDKIEKLEYQVETLTDENEGLRQQLKDAEETIGQLEARL